MNTLRWKWMLLTASWPLHLCFSRHSHSSLFFISGSNSNYGKLNHSENWNLTVMRVLYCVKVNPGREMKKRDYLKRGCCICAAGHTHTQTRHHYHWFQLGESFQSRRPDRCVFVWEEINHIKIHSSSLLLITLGRWYLVSVGLCLIMWHYTYWRCVCVCVWEPN